MSEVQMFSVAEYTAKVIQLRNELSDSIKTLSNARRAEVWEILNKLVQLERLDAGR